MRSVRAVLSRIANVFRGSGQDAEMRAELEAHLAMAIEENLRRGLAPAEARRQALLEAGGLLQAADAVRDQRGLPFVENLMADLRFAVRSLRRHPVFAVVVVITLALGIGANTAIFSVVHGVLLKPLPHREGDRLIYIRQSAAGAREENMSFSVPEVRDLRTGVASFAGLAEYSPWTVVYHSDDGAVRINVGLVTGNYFEVMGLDAVLGRVTQPGDDGAGAAPVMILTYDYWLTRFAGDSTVVGRQVRVDEKLATIVGVLEPAPFFPDRIDALLNMVASDHHLSAMMVEGRAHRMTEVVARLASGATLKQARSEVEAVYAGMKQAHPAEYDAARAPQIAILPFHEVLGERARLTLLLLMGAAAFVLVISVANVANLTLMRGVRREHELVVRAALGAGRARLRTLLLAENLLLTLIGAVLGTAIAVWGLRLLVSLAERYTPRAAEIELDAPVFGFLFLVAVLVAVVLTIIGTLPREGRLAPAILSGSSRVSGSLRKQRLQRSLVVVQVAISVMLLAGAGLLTRTLVRLSDVNTGLTTEEVLAMQVPLLSPAQLLYEPQLDGVAKARYEQMRQEIAALPGVIAVGVGAPGPLRSSLIALDLKAEGWEPVAGEAAPRAEFRTAGPQYFDAAGIRLLGGRGFTSTDVQGGERVVIINRTLADRLFPGENAIGRRVAWTGDVLRFTPFSGEWRTIIGVVASTQDNGLDAPPPAAVYMPFAQELAITGHLVIRAERDAAALVPAATRIVRRIAPSAPIERVRTISQIRDESVSPRRLNAVLISSFSLLAVIIAAVGIAGVLAFSVSARTTEIGIRMGLGADAARVQRMILGEGGVLLASGLAAGLLGAFFTARLIRGLLFGITPHDPATYAVVALVMVVIGLTACWVPALRAARVDPTITMRY